MSVTAKLTSDAEAKAGEALHRLGGLGEHRREDGVAQAEAHQAESDHGKAHDGARGEGDAQAGVERARFALRLVAGARGRRLRVAVGRDQHAPPASQRREARAALEDGADGGEGISGTKAREDAANNDIKKFIQHTGAGEHADELFAAVRQGMGLSDEEPEDDQNERS